MRRSRPWQVREQLFVFGMAWLLVLFTVGVVAATRTLADQAGLQLTALDGARLSDDGDALLLPGGGEREAAAELRFSLPPPDPGQARWVVWLGRDPVDALWLQCPGWR